MLVCGVNRREARTAGMLGIGPGLPAVSARRDAEYAAVARTDSKSRSSGQFADSRARPPALPSASPEMAPAASAPDFVDIELEDPAEAAGLVEEPGSSSDDTDDDGEFSQPSDDGEHRPYDQPIRVISEEPQPSPNISSTPQGYSYDTHDVGAAGPVLTPLPEPHEAVTPYRARETPMAAPGSARSAGAATPMSNASGVMTPAAPQHVTPSGVPHAVNLTPVGVKTLEQRAAVASPDDHIAPVEEEAGGLSPEEFEKMWDALEHVYVA